MTSYEVIYKRFTKKIEDLSLAQMDDADSGEMLLGYLSSALAEIECSKLKMQSDLSLKDDLLLQFTGNLYNSEIEVISMYMVVAWYEPKINSLEATSLFMGTKDQKWTDQPKFTKGLVDIQKGYRLRARNYFRNYAYKNNDYVVGA